MSCAEAALSYRGSRDDGAFKLDVTNFPLAQDCKGKGSDPTPGEHKVALLENCGDYLGPRFLIPPK
jgi:hypothetical protein